MTEMQLITCVVQRGKADEVWKAAKSTGAAGATVFFARGMGVRERLGLLSIAIAAEKEVMQIVARKEDVDILMQAIVRAGRLETPGMGFAFTQPVYATVGFVSAEWQGEGSEPTPSDRSR